MVLFPLNDRGVQSYFAILAGTAYGGGIEAEGLCSYWWKSVVLPGGAGIYMGEGGVV